MQLKLALSLLCVSASAPLYAADFEISRDPATTILYLSVADPAAAGFRSLRVQGDGRGYLARGPWEPEAPDSERFLEAREVRAIIQQAVDAGLTEWDGEALAEQLGNLPTAEAANRQELTLILQFDVLETRSGTCAPCERQVNFRGLEGAARRLPQSRELAGLVQLVKVLDDIAARPERPHEQRRGPYELATDARSTVLELHSVGISTGRYFHFLLSGAGKALLEEGFANEGAARQRWEAQFGTAALELLRKTIRDAELEDCDGSCLQAKVLRVASGRRPLIEDGSKDRFEIVLRDPVNGEQIRRHLDVESTFFYARAFPNLEELQALALVVEMAATTKKISRGEGQ